MDRWLPVVLLVMGCSAEDIHDPVELQSNSRQRRATLYTSECEAKYASISPKHSMCAVDVGIEVSLDSATKNDIVLKHNFLRAVVTPLAADMGKMVWDDNIAVVAAKWARQCSPHHDNGVSRQVPELPGVYIGQNYALGYSSWDSAIEAWYNEYEDYAFGVGSVNGKPVGHYTQVVTAHSYRIGCGQAYCPKTPYKKHYWCNYAIGQYGLKFPYENSTESCSACRLTCDLDATGRLCDCGGKLCLNHGELDIATCQCTCRKTFKGDTCETPVCGEKVCKNGGTLDTTTCSCKCKDNFAGDMCETLICPETDKSACGENKSYPPAHCPRYAQVREACPNMCGLCQHGCGNKVCQNGGTLNYQTCTCSCKANHAGEYCQQRDCPDPNDEPWYCTGDWTPEHCKKYDNVPDICPYMCGICSV